MLKKVFVICWRGLMEIWHQKKLLAFLLLYPLIFMIIFGSVFGGKTPPISFDLAIVRDGDGQLMETFISIFNKTEVIDEVEIKNRDDNLTLQAKNLIEKEGFTVVMFLPENFSEIMFSSINITLFYDESADTNTRSIAMGTISGIIENFSKYISKEKIKFAEQFGNLSKEEVEYMKGIAQPINMDVKGISPTKKELKYIDFLVPGLISMSIMWTGISGVASSLVEDRVRGIRRRILLTPTSGVTILAGSLLAHVCIIGTEIVVLLLVAIIGYNITIVGNVFLLSLFIIIGMTSMIGIGLIISGIAKTAEEASQLSMLVNFPMMFLAGVFFPISSGWMYYVSRIFPLTYINEGLREIMIRGAGLNDVLLPLFVSIIFTIASFMVGAILMRRGRE